MVLRVAGLPVWIGPAEMIDGTRTMLGWTADSVELVAALPGRVGRLLDTVEGLVGRVDAVVGRIEPLIDEVEAVVRRVPPVVDQVETVVGRVGPVVDQVETVVGRAGGVADAASLVVEKAGRTADGASRILDAYQPIAEQAAPLAQRFLREFSQDELSAAITLVDQLPQLTEHVTTDILPILATLDRVGPDVTELLDQLREIRQAVQGIPGFKMLVRRGEDAENSS